MHQVCFKTETVRLLAPEEGNDLLANLSTGTCHKESRRFRMNIHTGAGSGTHVATCDEVMRYLSAVAGSGQAGKNPLRLAVGRGFCSSFT